MKSFNMPYDIPESLSDEAHELSRKIEKLIGKFRSKCIQVRDDEEQQKINKRKAATWQYSIEILEGKWRVLFAFSPELGESKWSRPFKIINGVLFHAEYAYEGLSWRTANSLIPQGLFDENQLDEINKGWAEE